MPRADASRKHCAIYTRKSSGEGLEQEFNSLAAPREASEAFIRSQQHGSGAPVGNKNALRHGFYSAEAIARRRELSELIRITRNTLAELE